MISSKEKLEKASKEFHAHQKDWKSSLGTKEEFESAHKKVAKKMGAVKGYKHAVAHTTNGEKKGYKDPKTGLTHPSKGAFKDRYQGK